MATIKQKEAVKRLVGNGGNVTKAMRESGYSENTLNTPQKLTQSKGFAELLPDDFDEKLALIGTQALHATKRDDSTGEIVNDWTTIHKFWHDWQKRRYPEPKSDSDTNIQVNLINGLTEEQLRAAIKLNIINDTPGN